MDFRKWKVWVIALALLATCFMPIIVSALDFYPAGNIQMENDFNILQVNVIETRDFNCDGCINSEDVNDIDKDDIEGDINTFVDVAGDSMSGNLDMVDNNIINVHDLNVTAVKATNFFGGGVGITGITSSPDINGEDISVQDVNSRYLEADKFFGDGAGITGVTSTPDVNGADIAIQDLNVSGRVRSFDLNLQYESLFDLNNHYYQKMDINAGWYGKLDINTHWAPYIGATKDINYGIYGLTAEDLNAMALGIEGNAHILGTLYAANALLSGYATIGDGLNMATGLGVGDLNVQDNIYSSDIKTNTFTCKHDANFADIGTTGNIYTGNVTTTGSMATAGDLNVTTGAGTGVSIDADGGRICFPSDTCLMYIDYNGTAFVFGD